MAIRLILIFLLLSSPCLADDMLNNGGIFNKGFLITDGISTCKAKSASFPSVTCNADGSVTINGSSPGGTNHTLQYNLSGAFAGLTGSDIGEATYDALFSRISYPITSAPTNFTGYSEGGCDNCISMGTTWHSRIYSYKVVSGVTYYSTTYLDAGAYVTLSTCSLSFGWTSDPNADGYLVVNNVDGAGYLKGVDVGNNNSYSTDSNGWPGNDVANPPIPFSIGGNSWINQQDTQFYGFHSTADIKSDSNLIGSEARLSGKLKVQTNGNGSAVYATFGDDSYFNYLQTEDFVVATQDIGNFQNLAHFDAASNTSRSSFIISNSGDGGWPSNFIDVMVHGSTFPGKYYPSALGALTNAGEAFINFQTNGSALTEALIGSPNNIPISIYAGGTDDSDIIVTFNYGGSFVTKFNYPLTVAANLNLNAHNIVTDTTTGTKIATASNQKLGAFGVTPVIQQIGDIKAALIAEGWLGSGYYGASSINWTGAALNATNINWSSLAGVINKEGVNWTSFPASGIAAFNGSSAPIAATISTGLGLSGSTLSSNAVSFVSYQPGLLSAVNSTIGVNYKFSKASTVDNIIGSAVTFSCIGNPTVTMYECGTSTTCSGPTTIGTVTVTAAGTLVAGSISSATITAGDYIGWAITAGTCASIDIAATAQVHSN